MTFFFFNFTSIYTTPPPSIATIVYSSKNKLYLNKLIDRDEQAGPPTVSS